MHEHNWEFKYQISHIPYNFDTYFCECGKKIVKMWSGYNGKIENERISDVSEENRAYAEKIKKLIEE